MKTNPIPFRNWPHRFLNLLLYLVFCLLTGTGLLLEWRLPPGSRGGRGLEFLGLGRHDWGDIHFWMAVVFLILIVCHLALNWAWLRKIAAGPHPWRLVAGFALGLALIVFFVLAPVSSRHPGHHHQSSRSTLPSSQSGLPLLNFSSLPTPSESLNP